MVEADEYSTRTHDIPLIGLILKTLSPTLCLQVGEMPMPDTRCGYISRPVLIPYGRQTIEDDDIAAVVEVLRGDWLTQGPSVRAFEESFAAACDVPHAVAFSSGTAALHAAAYVAGLKTGDELMTSAITFAASANCGAYVGATPTFADIEDTWNMSSETVAAALTPATRGVVVVHFAGLPAPVAEIRAVVGDDVTIIEDAAHAIGSLTPTGPVGACRYADMATFSFHPVKTITSGEGGMVTTRRDDLAERLREFRTHGTVRDPSLLDKDRGGWYYEQRSLGFNYRLTDLQSALGRSQLAKLRAFRRPSQSAGRALPGATRRPGATRARPVRSGWPPSRLSSLRRASPRRQPRAPASI